MRLRRRAPKDVTASIEAAATAREEATSRLRETRDLVAVQGERARAERVTIIAALKRMRADNNLARLIMETVEKETGIPDDAGAGGD